jgi:phosphate transport system protein
MAGRVEEMIADSVRALVEQDVPLARRTIEADHLVDRAEVEVDELCLVILAKRQPWPPICASSLCRSRW